jgi:hypothetical protein
MVTLRNGAIAPRAAIHRVGSPGGSCQRGIQKHGGQQARASGEESTAILFRFEQVSFLGEMIRHTAFARGGKMFIDCKVAV